MLSSSAVAQPACCITGSIQGRISIAAAGDVTLRLVGPDKSTKEFGTTVDTLVALAFDMSRLVPLAGLPIVSSESLGERRWSPPAKA